MNNIKMGLEYELQLMVELENSYQVVNAQNFLFTESLKTQNIYSLLPTNIWFDLDNIEISTPTLDSYQDAVISANYSLFEKLIPILINDIQLEKFALFLPSPMCAVNYLDQKIISMDNDNNHVRIMPPITPSCMKHWNISFPDLYWDSAKWGYDYDALEKKGYVNQIKADYINLNGESVIMSSRLEIKIPYHYVPPEGNPDLMPNFEDIIIPKDNWRNIVCYYKNNTFVKVRDLR